MSIPGRVTTPFTLANLWAMTIAPSSTMIWMKRKKKRVSSSSIIFSVDFICYMFIGHKLFDEMPLKGSDCLSCGLGCTQ